jgi:hypothetical protein
MRARTSIRGVMKAIDRKRSRKRPAPARIRSEQKATGPASQLTSVRLDRTTRDAIIRLAEAFRRDNEASERHYLETYASDPIPENAIGLSDAFYRVMDAAEKHPERLMLDDDEIKEIRTRTESDLKQFVGDDYPPGEVDMIARGKEANVFLRKCLAEGQLVAYVRDPETAEILQLPHKGWDNIEFHPGELGWLQYNHVHPDDPLDPGPPEVMVRGMARPVFFLQDGFDLWFKKTFGNANLAGRKRGSGSYAQDDEPLLMKMRELVAHGKSVEGAARIFAKDAIGGGNETSKQTRLAKAYRKKFEAEGN